MSVVAMNGFQLRGAREVQAFDMIPRGYNGGKTFRNELKVGMGADAPPLLNDSIQRPHTMKVLGCKQEANSHRVLRRPPVKSTEGMYPATGYARGQDKGLAFLAEKPITGKIMPLASSHYAGMNNKIPNLQG